MRKITLFIAVCFLMGITQAQMLADFETEATTPEITAEGESGVTDNPDINDINPTSKVGYYNKIEGNWHYVTMLFPDTVDIGFNNTLTFKLRAGVQGRIFAKFWIGDEILIEDWAPEWDFQPLPDTWTDCSMDITAAMQKGFTKLELAACVDNEAEAMVYFDEVKLFNPDIGDGSPKADFQMSSNKVFTDETVQFDASGSYDYDGEIQNYEWDMGNGTTLNGVQVDYAFPKDSVYHVVLKVTDDEGNASTKAKYIFVLDKDSKFSDLAIVQVNPTINEKVEAVFQINGDYNNVYDPDEVTVDAEIEYPGGDTFTIPCFYYVDATLENTTWVEDTTNQAWMLRFSSTQTGTHKIKLLLKDKNGESTSAVKEVTINSGQEKGLIYPDKENNQFYRHSTGEPYTPMGINIGWNTIENYTSIINNLSAGKANVFRYWHTPFAQQALEWKNDGFYNGLGVYNQKAAAMTDSLINLSKKKDMNMQLVIFQHGMFSENVNEMWEDNPYNVANGGFVERAEEYFYNDACKVQTKKLLRYIVARWGYAKNIFAWELFNEVQFTGIHNSQSAEWYSGILQWHSEMSRYITSIDPFNHIITTSAEHDQLYDFDTIQTLDNIQYHLYSNRLLDEQVELDKQFRDELNTPVINGEYGTNNEADVPFEMQRHAIWNGIMTQVPHYMWVWEHYSELSWAGLFTMPANFIADEDFVAQENNTDYYFDAMYPEKELKTTGLKSGKHFYGYVYNNEALTELSGATCELKNIPFANYSVEYYLPHSNLVVTEDSMPLIKLVNKLLLPGFKGSLAFKVKYLSPYTLPIAIAGNDTTVAPNETVQLSGHLSSTPLQGATLNYEWVLAERPDQSNIYFSVETGVETSITPDVSGIYKIALKVNDGEQFSMPDTITITVSNPPVAIAGNDTTIHDDVRYFYLDATKSYDPDGDDISYLWSLITMPDDSQGNLLKYDEVEAILEIDAVGTFEIALTVFDGISYSKPDTVTVNVNGVHVASHAGSGVSFFPNPTQKSISIASDANNVTGAEIIDITGKCLGYFERKDNNRQFTIDLTTVADGPAILFIKVYGQNKEVVRVSRIVFSY